MAIVTDTFVVLTCYIEPDTEVGGYVSRCPALGVASQGETFKEGENNLREAVSLYLEALTEDGELEHVLRDRGIKLAVDRLPRATIRARTADGGLEFVAPFMVSPTA